MEEKPTAASPENETRVLIRHMGRNRRTRTLRAARAGHRRQGVILDNGTRIKKRGERLTQVSLQDLVNKHTRMLEYVRVGTIEVYYPTAQNRLSYDALVALLKEKGALKIDERSMVPQDVVPGSDSPMNSAPTVAPEHQVVEPPPPAPTPVEELEKELEEEAAEEETPTGYTEAELMAMNRKELNKIAKNEFDIKDPASLPSKQAVVDAILGK